MLSSLAMRRERTLITIPDNLRRSTSWSVESPSALRASSPRPTRATSARLNPSSPRPVAKPNPPMTLDEALMGSLKRELARRKRANKLSSFEDDDDSEWEWMNRESVGVSKVSLQRDERLERLLKEWKARMRRPSNSDSEAEEGGSRYSRAARMRWEAYHTEWQRFRTTREEEHQDRKEGRVKAGEEMKKSEEVREIRVEGLIPSPTQTNEKSESDDDLPSPPAHLSIPIVIANHETTQPN